VLAPSSADRAASEGLEVLAGAPVLLVHCATQQPLCIEQQHKVMGGVGMGGCGCLPACLHACTPPA
jgi:hypothetical protein